MKNIDEIKGIGPKNVKLLNSLGITTINNLLSYYPFRYEVYEKSDLNTVKDKDRIVIDGFIESSPKVYYINKKMDKMSFRINSNNNLYNITIFNRAFLKKRLNIGTAITIVGIIDKRKNLITVSELKLGLLNGTIIKPVYHTTYGLTSSTINKIVNNCIKEEIECNDYIPDYLIDKYKFMDKKRSIKYLHKPFNMDLLNKSILRIKYEELFLFMLKINYLKNNKEKNIGIKRTVDYKEVEKILMQIPFTLTKDQLQSINDIYYDLCSSKRMNRLLQGDVGSGKTIVSFISMYINYLSGYQSALMVPTEVLAIQHFKNIKKLFKNFSIEVGLLTGKLKAKEKKDLLKKISEGKINIIIGTHALISDEVKYKNLGLVITDEQHRFGVVQRCNLKNKGLIPDILYMSATPIPRTYALTLYGDMDISSIITLPSEKKQVITIIKKKNEIKDVLKAMHNELKSNHQIYVISPLIEESSKVNLENIYELERKMNDAFGSLYKIGVLHGKMSNNEKDEIMYRFKENKIQILISTTVIEVGIDVKNATMIVIWDAFRYGLSTLHQLRGRVGRNNIQSYCFLVSDKETERLNILTKTYDGFKISEEDFKLRGYGDLFGIKQSGDMTFDLADLKEDYNILFKAKEDSERFLKNDGLEKYSKIKELVMKSIYLD